jgi:hypothetical protein
MSAIDSHCTASSAPGPVISNLANDVWSISATPLADGAVLLGNVREPVGPTE